MSAPIRSDPYREPAPEFESPIFKFERLGRVLQRFGLLRFRWIRRLLGGQWERFVFLRWLPDAEDDRLWMREFWERERHGCGRGAGAIHGDRQVGPWQRVATWSVTDPNLVTSALRVVENDGLCLHVGTMRFLEFLGIRLALVAYYREDW
jgi:hypothetical protein